MPLDFSGKVINVFNLGSGGGEEASRALAQLANTYVSVYIPQADRDIGTAMTAMVVFE